MSQTKKQAGSLDSDELPLCSRVVVPKDPELVEEASEKRVQGAADPLSAMMMQQHRESLGSYAI